MSVAALYVETGGVYFGLPDVDPWDETRDARLYAGPWPVVAHPPCKHWSQMSNCRPEIKGGEDGGCFEAALAAVETYGGVLEHPALTAAWKRYGLCRPGMGGWNDCSLHRLGFVTEVDQAAYGLPFHKLTWLYYVGDDPPALDWRIVHTALTAHNAGGGGRDARSKTPLAFRDVLLDMARSAARDTLTGSSDE